MTGGGGAAHVGREEKAVWGNQNHVAWAESYEPKTAGPGIGAWPCLYQRDLEREEPGTGGLGLGAVSPGGGVVVVVEWSSIDER